MSDIIQKAKKYVYNLTKNILTPENWYYFHNMEHFEEVYQRSKYIADKLLIHEEEKENLAIASYFHDVWYIKQYYKNEPIWAEIAKQWLEEQKFPKKRIEKIQQLILATYPFAKPNNIHEMIIKDADLDNLWRDDFFEKAEAIWKETLNMIQFYTPIQIEERQSKFIENKNKLFKIIKEKNLLLINP